MPYTPEHRLATRERILASARRLFNRNGLSEVTIDAVMASAGLTRGAFYNYFNSKEELYAEAITLFSRRFPAEPWQCPDLEPLHEGANLARMIVSAYLAVGDPATADDLCEAARKLAFTIGAWEEPPAEPA